MLTPPEVTTASQAATPRLQRRRDGVLVVGGGAQVDRLAARLRAPGPAAWAGWSRGSGPAAAAPAPSTSSSPVESTPDPGRRGTPSTSARPEAGQHPEVAGGEHGRRPRRPSGRPAGPRRPAHVVAGRGRHLDRRPAVAVGATSARPSRWRRRRRASARRHDPHRLARARPSSPAGSAPAARVPTTAEAHRGAGRVGRPHREPVHGRVGERRHVDPPTPPARPAPGPGRRPAAAERAAAGAGGEDPGPGVLEGDHLRRASSAAPARPGTCGTRGRGPPGRWRSRPWPAGSRACRRCRSGRPRTGSRRPSGP